MEGQCCGCFEDSSMYSRKETTHSLTIIWLMIMLKKLQVRNNFTKNELKLTMTHFQYCKYCIALM